MKLDHLSLTLLLPFSSSYIYLLFISYHLSTSHGISSVTLTLYDKPSKYRIIYLDKITNDQSIIYIKNT